MFSLMTICKIIAVFFLLLLVLRDHVQYIQDLNTHHRLQSELRLHVGAKKDSSLPETDTGYLHEDTTTGRHSGPSAQLRTLAAQLGECCLATDLAALLSQRRSAEQWFCEDVKSVEEEKRLDESFGVREMRLDIGSERMKKPDEIRRMTLSLFARVVEGISLSKFAGSLFPTNALFMYQSSQHFQNVCRESQVKVRRRCHHRRWETVNVRGLSKASHILPNNHPKYSGRRQRIPYRSTLQ